MNELKQYIEFIENLICRYWEERESTYDYELCKWYSRYHSKYLTTEELLEWVMDFAQPPVEDSVYYDDTLPCGCCACCGCSCND